MDILELIKAKRIEKGYTISQMAKKLQIGNTTYQNLENNDIILKVHDFFKIIEILEIPLELFEKEKYIVISESDFNKLKESANQIKDIAERIQSNANIINHEKIDVDLEQKQKDRPRKQYCQICGKPSKFYPLCSEHALMYKEGKITKDQYGNFKLKE